MLVTYLFPVFISMQFSDSQAGDLGTGLSLRNPVIPHPSSISFHIPQPRSLSPHLLTFQSCSAPLFYAMYSFILQKPFFIQVIQMQGKHGNTFLGTDTVYRDINVIPRCFAIIEDCTVHFVLPLFTSIAVKICPSISLSLQRCCLGLAVKKSRI